MPAANPVARFETSAGSYEVEFFVDRMPITASNFIDLVQRKFYDGLHFHRVIANFMLQGGCSFSKNAADRRAGTGHAPANSTYKIWGTDKVERRNGEGGIKDEHTAKISNLPFTLSCANSGRPGSNSSQFFVNTANNTYLDWWDRSNPSSKHPVFGKVVKGLDVVKKIERCPKGRQDAPSPPVKIIRAYMIEQKKEDQLAGLKPHASISNNNKTETVVPGGKKQQQGSETALDKAANQSKALAASAAQKTKQQQQGGSESDTADTTDKQRLMIDRASQLERHAQRLLDRATELRKRASGGKRHARSEDEGEDEGFDKNKKRPSDDEEEEM